MVTMTVGVSADTERTSTSMIVRAPLGAAVRLAVATALLATPLAGQQITVVTTLPTYAAIAREITGDLAEVSSIARGDEDPHFVNPRPSFAARIRRADLFVTTGLDLELWVPSLLDRANNSKVIEGAPGHVVAYSGVKLLEVPANVSRTGGDVHVFGNPHVHTDPVNAIQIARNIGAGLRRVDPDNAAAYDANRARFEDRVLRRLFGERMIDMLGAETVYELAAKHEFRAFIESQTLEGRPLTAFLGGWSATLEPFRGRRIVCYHKNWAYFSNRFGIPCAMFVEPLPGIPPSPGHVRDVIDFIRTENIPVLLAANYFSRTQVERVASRTGATALVVAEHVAGEDGIDDYFSLVDAWVNRLAAAMR